MTLKGIIGFGLLLMFLWIWREGDRKSIKEESSVDRSKTILDEIGGINNIDINLSKYSEKSQLIVLKNKKICIGYNNYETKKIIDFNSILNLEININNATIGSAYESSNNKVKEIIESIIVYIHTKDSTEDLIFSYSSYELDEAQESYIEILKGLKRLKVMLEDYANINDANKETSIAVNEKSIPEQIKEYKELLDMDAITKEEFEMKKKELLNKK